MFLFTALAFGFFGSLHCIGMCGPIVLVLPGAGEARMRFLLGRLLYNLGRAATYAVLGFIIGLIGATIALAGWQQMLGIVSGSIMILSVIIPSKVMRHLVPARMHGTATGAVKDRLGRLLKQGSASSLFTIGVLNGFLPCGLVYMALAASLALGDPAKGAGFMFLFGLGTMPALLATAFAAGVITHSLRRRITRLLPVAVVLMGAFFILRGLSLGIPYLSPDMAKVSARMSAAPPSMKTPTAMEGAAKDSASHAQPALQDSVPPCCRP